jgi:DNA-directed RNA polymerase specialized sigma24 family protein
MSNDSSSKDDSGLLRMAQQGDEGAVGALYVRYREDGIRLATTLLRQHAADIDVLVEDTFSKTQAKIHEVKKGNFGNFFFAAVKNKCLDILRRKDPEILAGYIDALADRNDNNRSADSDIHQGLDQWRADCEAIIQAAGFLQPKEVQQTFLDTMTAINPHSSIIRQPHADRRLRWTRLQKAMNKVSVPLSQVKEWDRRPGLDPAKCLIFLLRETLLLFDSGVGQSAQLLQYSDAVKKLLQDEPLAAAPASVSAVVTAHLVTEVWPGWPFTPLDFVAYRSKTPQRLRELCAALDQHGLRACPPKFKVLLQRLHDEMHQLRRCWEWPPL